MKKREHQKQPRRCLEPEEGPTRRALIPLNPEFFNFFFFSSRLLISVYRNDAANLSKNFINSL